MALIPLVISLLILPFSPLLAIFLLFLIISILSYARINSRIAKDVFFFSSVLFVIASSLFSSSFGLFVTAGHDFASYYNNYLYILEGRDVSQWFSYGGGVEIGVPFIHWILKFIVGEPKPYLIYLCHAVILNVLLIFLIARIYRFERVSGENILILFLFVIVFYRFYAGLNAIRQGYASFFILFAFFSNSKGGKLLHLLIATLFHTTSIPIYLICVYVMKVDGRNFYKSIASLGAFIVLLVSVFIVFVKVWPLSFIVEKSLFLVSTLLSPDVILESIKAGFKVNACYFFAFLFSLFAADKSLRYKLLLLMVVTTIVSPLPSLLRVLFPFSNILQGYFLYKSLADRVKGMTLFFIFLAIVLNFALFVRNPMYNYSYQFIDTSIFYYFDALQEERKTIIREDLPTVFDVGDNKDSPF